MDEIRMEQAKEMLTLSCLKMQYTIDKIGNELLEYKATPTGQYVTEHKEDLIPLRHLYCWTQSFFTGEAILAYKITKDESYLRWVNQFYQEYYDKVFVTPLETMHDLGFLYTPYAVALYKLLGDQKSKELGIKAADELAKRFLPKGGYIQAWGQMNGQIPPYISNKLRSDTFFTGSKGLVIIDSMMNIPLLFWASQVTKHPFYERIAVVHADTILKYLVRDDNTVCHAYRFDVDTGEAMEEANDCGYGVGSHWARGTAWAVYGFAIAYGYTNDQRYYDTAVSLACKFMDLCEKNGMPVWDFRLPKEVTEQNYDTSAAVILANGLLELMDKKKEETCNEGFSHYIDKVVKSVYADYFNKELTVSGLLACQNGQNVYTCFGDYYLMELLGKLVYHFDSIW